LIVKYKRSRNKPQIYDQFQTFTLIKYLRHQEEELKNVSTQDELCPKVITHENDMPIGFSQE